MAVDPPRTLLGEGSLRRSGNGYVGEIRVYGITYELTADVRVDDVGRYFGLRVWFTAPMDMPAHLHVPLLDGPLPGRDS